MNRELYNLFYNYWGGGGPQLVAMEKIASEEPHRFNVQHNGYNNTHEAVRFLRIAAMHLGVARLNGESSEEFVHALEALGEINTLIERMCEEEDFKTTYSETPMKERFRRVWRGVNAYNEKE